MFKLFLSIKLYCLLLFISVAVTVKHTMTPALPTRLLETLWMRWSKGTYKGTHQVSVSIWISFLTIDSSSYQLWIYNCYVYTLPRCWHPDPCCTGRCEWGRDPWLPWVQGGQQGPRSRRPPRSSGQPATAPQLQHDGQFQPQSSHTGSQ